MLMMYIFSIKTEIIKAFLLSLKNKNNYVKIFYYFIAAMLIPSLPRRISKKF